MRASLFRRLNKRPWFNEIKAIFSLEKNSRYTKDLPSLLLISLICFLMVKIGHKIVESGLGWGKSARHSNGAMLGHFFLFVFLPFVEFDDIFWL